jgi:Ca2+-binding RTX toxin-like protein
MMTIKGRYTGKVDFQTLVSGLDFIGFETPPPKFKVDAKHERISFIDPENAKNSIVLETKHLAVDKHGHITGGTITEAHFMVAAKEAVTIQGLHASAAKLETALDHGLQGLYGYFNVVLNGNVTETGDKFDNMFEIGAGGKAAVDGGAGDDSLSVWHKKDIVYDGAGGEDTLIFAPRVPGAFPGPNHGAEVDLAAGTGVNAYGGALKTIDVEDVTGTVKSDTLLGDGKANVLDGTLGGDDVLKGRGGDDTIVVGGDSFSHGPAVKAKITADGGGGNDTLTYNITEGDAVNVLDLSDRSHNTGLFANDRISNFESFSFVTYFFAMTSVAVHFTGTGASETIRLATGGADDIVEGGGGNDVIAASFGNNVFVFNDNFGSDTIEDFSLSNTNVIRFATSVFSDFEDVMAHASQQGSDVVIDGGGNDIRLTSVSLGNLTEANFDFV